jgi:hypothetical protein
MPPCTVAALSVPSALGRMLRVVSKMEQRIVMYAGDHFDVAALPAITSARATARHKLLTSKRKATVTPVACFYGDYNFIYKQES